MKVKLINYTGSIVTLVKTIRCAEELSAGPRMGLYNAKVYAEKLIQNGHCELAYTFDQELDDRRFVINCAITDENYLHPVIRCDCANPSQCWEQCGELGNDERFAVASDLVIPPLEPATDKMYVWAVGSKTFNILFSTEEKAAAYAATFPASNYVQPQKIEVL